MLVVWLAMLHEFKGGLVEGVLGSFRQQCWPLATLELAATDFLTNCPQGSHAGEAGPTGPGGSDVEPGALASKCLCSSVFFCSYPNYPQKLQLKCHLVSHLVAGSFYTSKDNQRDYIPT